MANGLPPTKKIKVRMPPKILDAEQLRIQGLATTKRERLERIANDVISLLSKDQSIITKEIPDIFQTASNILAQKMNKATVKTIKELK